MEAMKKFLKNKYVLATILLYVISLVGIWIFAKFINLSFWNPKTTIMPTKGKHFFEIIHTNIISMNMNLIYSILTAGIFNIINLFINFLNVTRALQILMFSKNSNQLYLLINHGFVEWFTIIYEFIFVYYVIFEFLIIIRNIIKMKLRKKQIIKYLKYLAINYTILIILYLISDILESFF